MRPRFSEDWLADYQGTPRPSAPVAKAGKWGMGRRADLGDTFFRSAWEANYARYLNLLKQAGEISEWQYEPETFWFEKIRRGVRSYKPDFKVWERQDAEPYYIELKGWMDDKSKTKLKRMKKYHPRVKVVLVDAKQYRALARTVAPLIPSWERARQGAPAANDSVKAPP